MCGAPCQCYGPLLGIVGVECAAASTLGTGIGQQLALGHLYADRHGADLPFALYSTFVLEERFRFQQDQPAIVVDAVKSAVLSVVVGIPLVGIGAVMMGQPPLVVAVVRGA